MAQAGKDGGTSDDGRSCPASRDRAAQPFSGMSEVALRENIIHLRRFARRLLRNAADADDLVQDCLLRMLAREDGRGPVREPRRFLLTSARNLCITRYKQRARRASMVALADMVEELGYPAGQQERLKLRDLARGLARLPASQRQAVVLVALENLSCEQAAARLGVPVGTLQSRVHRARASLKPLIAGEEAGIPSRRRLGAQTEA